MFERLTADKVYLNSIRFGIQVNFPPHCGHEKAKEVDDFVKNVFDRLAAYEDSGLSPEEVQKLKKSDASKEQCTIDQHGEIHRLRDELKRYKQAEQEGRLVVLPCKVGDTVYEPFAGKVYEKTVDRIIINRFTTPQIWIETKLPFATPRLKRWDMAIGKTVFLTREEAEGALQKEAQHE